MEAAVRRNDRSNIEKLLVGAALVLASAGCGLTPGGSWTQAGSIVIGSNGKLFIAANDNGGVAVVDPTSKSGALAFIATGDRPEHIIGRGNAVFVSNRQSRTVTQIDTDKLRVVRQMSVGAEPMGMDLTDDGLLLVCNAMSGTVQALDVSDGSTRWTVSMNEEIRGIAVGPGGKAYVPSYKSAALHIIDTHAGIELGAPTDISASNFPGYQVRGVESILLEPSSGIAYLPHTQSASGPLATITLGTYKVNAYYSQTVAVTGAPPTVSTVTTVDTKRGAIGSSPWLSTGLSIAGPKVAALDPPGRFLYLVSFLGDSVVVGSPTTGSNAQAFSATAKIQGYDSSGSPIYSSPQVIPVGHGPSGIAISSDDVKAFVYNSFDHSVSVLGNPKDKGFRVMAEITGITPQTLTTSQQNGRILFHAAYDPRMSAQTVGGVACASCHPDGREDGHTWSFAEGVRNTPALVGRHLELTAPYHWDGQLGDPESFFAVVKVRMGGQGIDPSDYEDIFSWLESEPAPDNPNRAADGSLTPDQSAGRSLFVSAGCVSCHGGPAYTDNGFHDIGTAFTSAPFAMLASGTIPAASVTTVPPNTPSLLGVFASAPYLHDGSRATLRARITNNPGDQHGVTSNLTSAQVDQLVAYLETL
jgi:DNA-binding beta-propeller fold protein YncE